MICAIGIYHRNNDLSTCVTKNLLGQNTKLIISYWKTDFDLSGLFMNGSLIYTADAAEINNNICIYS